MPDGSNCAKAGIKCCADRSENRCTSSDNISAAKWYQKSDEEYWGIDKSALLDGFYD